MTAAARLFDFPSKLRWLKCHFCGERVRRLEDGWVELYSLKPDGSLHYPGERWNDLTIVLAHGGCGPDVGYAIPLLRLVNEGAEDWINHLHGKMWWNYGFDAELLEAEKYAKLIAARAVKEERPVRTILSPKAPPIPKGDPRYITKGMRAYVLERDGFKCRRCNAAGADGVRLVVDHVKPVSKGGSGDHDNLQTLCWDCNAGKSDRDPHPHDLR